MQILLLLLFGILIFVLKQFAFEHKRKQRRDYYRNEYLKSDAWKRKRYVVLKRDNWRCVFCGSRATQVHHKRYAKYNIGKEPIEWLVSVCKSCHDKEHD
jgi:cbb3-type cytochrome oxidase subunit 3